MYVHTMTELIKGTFDNNILYFIFFKSVCIKIDVTVNQC